MGNLFSSRISGVRVGRGDTKKLSRDEVHQIVKNAPGVNSDTKIIINDRDYIAPEEKRFKKYNKDDKTEKLKYKAERSDCDDFTRVYLGRLAENLFQFGSNDNRAVAVGEIQGRLYLGNDTPIAHSMVIAIVNRKGTPVVVLSEPQNDKMYGLDGRNTIWLIHL